MKTAVVESIAISYFGSVYDGATGKREQRVLLGSSLTALGYPIGYPKGWSTLVALSAIKADGERVNVEAICTLRVDYAPPIKMASPPQQGMARYSKERRCPKCGAPGATDRFHIKSSYDPTPDTPKEWIDRTCSTCGHTRRELPLDYKGETKT